MLYVEGLCVLDEGEMFGDYGVLSSILGSAEGIGSMRWSGVRLILRFGDSSFIARI